MTGAPSHDDEARDVDVDEDVVDALAWRPGHVCAPGCSPDEALRVLREWAAAERLWEPVRADRDGLGYDDGTWALRVLPATRPARGDAAGDQPKRLLIDAVAGDPGRSPHSDLHHSLFMWVDGLEVTADYREQLSTAETASVTAVLTRWRITTRDVLDAAAAVHSLFWRALVTWARHPSTAPDTIRDSSAERADTVRAAVLAHGQGIPAVSPALPVEVLPRLAALGVVRDAGVPLDVIERHLLHVRVPFAGSPVPEFPGDALLDALYGDPVEAVLDDFDLIDVRAWLARVTVEAPADRPVDWPAA